MLRERKKHNSAPIWPEGRMYIKAPLRAKNSDHSANLARKVGIYKKSLWNQKEQDSAPIWPERRIYMKTPLGADKKELSAPLANKVGIHKSSFESTRNITQRQSGLKDGCI